MKKKIDWDEICHHPMFLADAITAHGGDLKAMGVSYGEDRKTHMESLSHRVEMCLVTKSASNKNALIIFDALAKLYKDAPDFCVNRVASLALENVSWRMSALQAHPAIFQRARTEDRGWDVMFQMGAEVTYSRRRDETTAQILAFLGELKKLGLDGTQKDRDGRTPAFMAAFSRSAAVFEAFAQIHGREAIATLRDNRQRTPLHELCSLVFLGDAMQEMSERLIAAGADVHAPDVEGETPLASASKNHSSYLAKKLLREHDFSVDEVRKAIELCRHDELKQYMSAHLASMVVRDTGTPLPKPL